MNFGATNDIGGDDWDMSDIDILQLTSSQEIYLFEEIRNDNTIYSAAPIYVPRWTARGKLKHAKEQLMLIKLRRIHLQFS